MTVRSALARFKRSGDPVAGSTDPMSAGNGSLMRLAPLALRYWNDRLALRDAAARQSSTTHGTLGCAVGVEEQGVLQDSRPDDFRRAYSTELLRGTAASTKQIAYALGFVSENSLRRPFVRWPVARNSRAASNGKLTRQ